MPEAQRVSAVKTRLKGDLPVRRPRLWRRLGPGPFPMGQVMTVPDTICARYAAMMMGRKAVRKAMARKRPLVGTSVIVAAIRHRMGPVWLNALRQRP